MKSIEESGWACKCHLRTYDTSGRVKKYGSRNPLIYWWYGELQQIKELIQKNPVGSATGEAGGLLAYIQN